MMKWKDNRRVQKTEREDEATQTIKLIISGVLFCLLLTTTVTPTLLAGDMASVQATIRFVPIQELSIESNLPSVTVEKAGKTEKSTKIDLDNLKSKKDLYLPEAVDVMITSSANWHLLARVEDTYASPEAKASFFRINLAISNPSSVQGVADRVLSLAEGEEGELAKRSGAIPIRTYFSVDYELELDPSNASKLSGVGGEIVYTLMKL